MARSAESRRLPCGVVWVMTRMRLYAYAPLRVVARSGRNQRGALARIHRRGQCRPSGSRTGAVGPEVMSTSS